MQTIQPILIYIYSSWYHELLSRSCKVDSRNKANTTAILVLPSHPLAEHLKFI